MLAYPGIWKRITPAWPLSALGAVLTLLRTGFDFGLNNNVFHLPVVLHLARMPQFANDPFVMSLSRFVSPIYPLLGLIADQQNVAALFLLGLALNHAATLYALLRIAAACGITRFWEQAALTMLMVASRGLYYVSPVGGDALIISVFSHSELARAVALFAIALALERRFVFASASCGLAFALNAFVGVWTLPVLAALFLTRPASIATSVRELVRCALAFAVPAGPILIWILYATKGARVEFDYPAYLAFYAPHHFFISFASSQDLARMASAIVAGAAAAAMLRRFRSAGLALGALAAVFAVGALVGAVSTSRLILNLHLLRVAGMMTLLSIALVSAACVQSFRLGRIEEAICTASAAAGLFVGSWPLVAASMLVALCVRRWSQQPWLAWPAWAKRNIGAGGMAAAAALALGGSMYAWTLRAAPITTPDGKLAPAGARNEAWQQLTTWVRLSTPLDAVFMIPPDLPDFRSFALRRQLSSAKDGASVMWAPDTYAEWYPHVLETRNLKTRQDRAEYACANGVGYLVSSREKKDEPPSDLQFGNTWFFVQKLTCRPEA